jgi:hypothetical protein
MSLSFVWLNHWSVQYKAYSTTRPHILEHSRDHKIEQGQRAVRTKLNVMKEKFNLRTKK